MESAQDEKFLPTELPKELSSGEASQIRTQHDVKTLLSWNAPGRPYIKRGKQFYMTSLLIALLIGVILFLFSQYLLIFLVAALVFLGFSFSLVPPKDFHYRISTEGIMIEDHFYIWRELYDFYFLRKEGVDTLYIRAEDFFPGLLTINIGDLHKEQLKQALLPFLPYREVVKPNIMDRSGEWLYKNFPLERS